MQHFVFYRKENYLAFTKTRSGETKLGEKIRAVTSPKKWQEELKASPAKFVIVGIPEDIGVKANHGSGGTQTAWPSFLSSFLNIQHNNFLNGESVLLLGYFDFAEFQQKAKSKSIEYKRELVTQIDKQVADVVQKIVQCGKIPVVIGGGHNNAYGNIKGAALGLHHLKKTKAAKMNVLNLDAHADFRHLEGRHSGNGFSYAMKDGYLQKYGVLGLHESYMTQPMLEEAKKNKNISAYFLEDLLIRDRISVSDATDALISFTKDTYTGIEIDLDAIENILTSAITPSGFSAMQARRFIHRAASECKVAYLHICEGIAEAANGVSSPTTGKLIAYLVSDFIKAVK